VSNFARPDARALRFSTRVARWKIALIVYIFVPIAAAQRDQRLFNLLAIKHRHERS
jgi:hypothetical protein